MQQPTQTPATSPAWTAPRLVKVGTIADVANNQGGSAQTSGNKT